MAASENHAELSTLQINPIDYKYIEFIVPSRMVQNMRQ
jgi:hypothetical protein